MGTRTSVAGGRAAGAISVAVLTHNRREEIQRTLEHLLESGEAARVCVVDNGSNDGTGEMIARRFPSVHLVRLPRNIGAAGRNHGVRALATPYVAFCDDDTWWEPGSLSRAADLFDHRSRLAAVTARVLVGPEDREDPTSGLMAASPLPPVRSLAGVTPVAGILAGACAVRRDAFLAVGGYEPRLFLGGEERLLGLDLMAAGWHLGYAPELVVHHHPSPLRDAGTRRRLLLRNALWCAWLRRPLAGALRETVDRVRAAAGEPGFGEALAGALRGLPWVLRRRRVIPPHVEARLRLIERKGA